MNPLKGTLGKKRKRLRRHASVIVFTILALSANGTLPAAELQTPRAQMASSGDTDQIVVSETMHDEEMVPPAGEHYNDEEKVPESEEESVTTTPGESVAEEALASDEVSIPTSEEILEEPTSTYLLPDSTIENVESEEITTDLAPERATEPEPETATASATMTSAEPTTTTSEITPESSTTTSTDVLASDESGNEPEPLPSEEAPSPQPMMQPRAMPMAQPMAVPTSSRCSPGTYFTLGTDGAVFKGAVGSATFSQPTSDFQFARGWYAPGDGYRYRGDQVNALGISGDGNQMFALDRWDWANVVDILKYDAATGTNGAVKRVTIPAPRDTGSGFSTASIIGGSVGKGDHAGKYYFGGFTQGAVTNTVWVEPEYGWVEVWNPYTWRYEWRWTLIRNGYYRTDTVGYSVRFNLWRYDPATDYVDYLGYSQVSYTQEKQPGANGDLAFDAEGNLYALYSTTAGSKIIPITSDAITQAEARVSAPGDDFTTNNNYELASQETRYFDVPGNIYYGMTFISDGSMLTQYDMSATSVAIGVVNTDTGKITRMSPSYTLRNSTSAVSIQSDLAGCNSFPTISLQKDAQRSQENHEVKLEIFRKGDTTALASAITNGLQEDGTIKEGLQDQLAGPIPANSGQTYIVRESGTIREGTTGQPTDRNFYDITLECVDTSTGNPVSATRVTGSQYMDYEVTVPTVTSTNVPNVACTYSNKAKVGDVIFNKVDGEGHSLAGSEWFLRLTGEVPEGMRSEYSLVDCIDGPSGTCDESSLDRDPRAGHFLIENLPYGTYEVVEKKAPEGFQIRDRTYEVTLNRDVVTLGNAGDTYNVDDLGDITNEQLPGTVVWVKLAENPYMPDDPHLLTESQWSVTKVDAQNKPIGEPRTINDCTSEPCAPGGDADPIPGQFLLTDLTVGRYALQEVAAPLGFATDTTIHYFDVPADGAVDLGRFENKLINKPSLPKTGSFGVIPQMVLALALAALAYGLASRRPQRPGGTA